MSKGSGDHRSWYKLFERYTSKLSKLHSTLREAKGYAGTERGSTATSDEACTRCS